MASIGFDDAENLATYNVGDATYDASGTLLRRRLARDTVAEIAGVVCEGSVDLHPNGRVHQTTLGASLASRHGTLPARSRIELDERGELVSATVSTSCTLGGCIFAASDRVVFTGGAPVKDEHAWTFYTPYSGTADAARS